MLEHYYLAVVLLTAWCSAYSLPPDKIPAQHIIRTRSIDLNNAQALTMETRLGDDVEPTGYELSLEPYLEDGRYQGHVKINVTWRQAVDKFSLHCGHQLNVTSRRVTVFDSSNTPSTISVKSFSVDFKKPIATLEFEKTIPKLTKGYLEFEFNGDLEMATSEALFKTTYKTEQDIERVVVATQFRATNARRVFPCFDEPAFKTPFELSVVRPKGYVALSNTPALRVVDIDGEPNSVRVQFARTPPMSTFALGLIIAEIEQYGNTTHYKDDNGNDIELRVWGRPEYHQALEGANERLVQVFREIASFWQVPLPLRRLDVVALPNYQGVKPADNWGLIVFKESELSAGGYLPLAQELTYQWAGILATPAWWSDAHINKALSGYLAAETAFKINNGVEMEGKWPMTVLYSIYYEFSKRYPHSRITGMKQETACTKIELILRMMNYTLGGQTFKKGLRKFISTHKYKTFTSDDVWDALNSAALEDSSFPKDLNVKTVAKSWIEKDRLPLVTAERNYLGNSVLLKQKMYLRERPHDVPDAETMTWQLPVVISRADHPSLAPLAWMKDQKEITLDNMPPKDSFIIINPEEIAPYPVNYDERNWNLLSKHLQSDNRETITELTRAKLLHDAWNLAFAGELSFATALNMTLFLKNERHHLVWDPVFTMIDHISGHICQCMQGKFQAYIRTLLSPLYEELLKEEKEDEPKWKKNLRSLAKTFLCKAGYKPCIEEAQDQFSKWMHVQNPDEGNPISNQYICPVFKWGTREEWEFGLNRVLNFPQSRKQSERTYLLKTLAGCAESEYKITRLLNITLLEQNGNFSETDVFLVLNMFSGNPAGYSTLFNFLNRNWDTLREKYISKTNLWDNLVSSATSQFTTKEGLELVTGLYRSHRGQFSSAEHIIEKSLRNIKEESKWSEDNLPVMDKWLDSYLANNDVQP